MTAAAFIAAAGVNEVTPQTVCIPTTAPWIYDALRFGVFQYVWTTMVYNHVRLATVAGTIGTWYFHSNQVRCATHYNQL